MENHFDKTNDEDRFLQPDSKKIELPAGFEERVVNQLIERGMIVPARPWFQRSWLKVAASVIVAVGLFAGGYYIGKDFFSSRPLASAPTHEYLLLLYNPIDFISDPQHVSEYGTWMLSINNTDASASGEELKDYGWTIEKKNNVINMEGRPVSGEFGSLSGFFLLKASSPERALEIAASCPHVKYNGVIELRPVEPH